MKDTGRTRTAKALIVEECLLHTMDINPGASERALAAATGTSRSTIWYILHFEALLLFHLQRLQLLQPIDQPRHITFAQSFPQK